MSAGGTDAAVDSANDVELRIVIGPLAVARLTIPEVLLMLNTNANGSAAMLVCV